MRSHQHDEDELERQQALRRATPDSSASTPVAADAVLRLQRTAGNTAVSALVSRQPQAVVQRDTGENETFDASDDPFAHQPVITPADDSIGKLVFELREQEDKDAPLGITRPTASLDAGAANLRSMSDFAQRTVVHYGSKYGTEDPSDADKTGIVDAGKRMLKDFVFGSDTSRAVAKAASENQKQVDHATVTSSLLRASLLGWLDMIDSSNSAWGYTRMQAKECNIDLLDTKLPDNDPRRLAPLGGGSTPDGAQHLDVDQVAAAGNQSGKDAKSTNFKQGIDNTSLLQAKRNHMEKSDSARAKQRMASQLLFEGATKANAEALKAEDDKKQDWQGYKLALDAVITAVEVGAGGAELPEGKVADQVNGMANSVNPLAETGGVDKAKLADWGVAGLKGVMDEKIASIDRVIGKLKEVQANRQAVISAQREIAIVEEYQIALRAERDSLITLDEESQKMLAAMQEYGGALGQAVEDKGMMPKGFSSNEADLVLLGRIRQTMVLTELATRSSARTYVDQLRGNLAPLQGMTDGPWPALVTAESQRSAQIDAVVAEADRILGVRMKHLDALQSAFLSGMAGAGQVNKPY
ncbi:hypothetical protein [Tenggerimyces flavus]|uniref:Uncharacterized protein n=1 Tax=Tenggerimyces flavus TaxID=1708749 RepID=A0ABV7YJ33_9ACTN|nr:hypothetical protein [Tenggerimyces flavus]MBM7789966.1 hypothetical protein [Tenggerimyces flavus]